MPNDSGCLPRTGWARVLHILRHALLWGPCEDVPEDEERDARLAAYAAEWRAMDRDEQSRAFRALQDRRALQSHR